ncbi:hypothetical protein [Aliiroseovarius sp. YM-037]
MKERAEVLDGPTAQAIADLARANGLAIQYGLAERAHFTPGRGCPI